MLRRHTGKRFSTMLLAAAMSVASAADGEVIGTVELSLDGQAQTWYVLDAGSEMLPTALWLAMGPERAALSITAYRTPEIDFVADEATGSPLPDGDAEALVISIGFARDAGQAVYPLPPERDAGPAVVMLLRNWSDPLDSITLHDGPGEIRLTEIQASIDQPSRFAGTFHGTLQATSGETTHVVENGRFDVERVRFFERR